MIAGERRLRAAEAAGLKEIPAQVKEATDEGSMVLALIENIQREDLNLIEEAEGYRMLIRDFSLTQESAAKRLGKPRATIANSLRLLDLSDIAETEAKALPEKGKTGLRSGMLDLRGLSYQSPVWMSGDGACCPSGGHVKMELAIEKNRVVPKSYRSASLFVVK